MLRLILKILYGPLYVHINRTITIGIRDIRKHFDNCHVIFEDLRMSFVDDGFAQSLQLNNYLKAKTKFGSV